MKHTIHGIARLLTPLVALALMTASADAQVTKPFKITGSGIAPEGLPLPGQAPRPHDIEGQATHLGNHTGLGSVQTDTAEFDPSIGDFGGFVGEFGSGEPFVFVAANGDELACHYGRTDKGATVPGVFELTIVGIADGGAPIVEAFFIAEFVPQPESTGRFAGASGGWIMFARTKPFVLGSSEPLEYSWEGAGKLTFQKPAAD